MQVAKTRVAYPCEVLFAILLIVFTLGQVLLLAFTPFDVAPDEAHYWEWSKRLDWSYYSKGPLIAWVIAASRTLVPDSYWSLKLGAIVFSVLHSIVFFFLARSLGGGFLALLGWIAVRSMPIVASLGLFMTTDPLLSLFWLLMLMFAYRAVMLSDPRWWIPAFISIGLGAWGKYTILINAPAFAVMLLLTPGLRSHLRSRYFVVACLSMLVLLLPIFFWNYQHSWVNFQHNGGHLLDQRGVHIRLRSFFELLGGQLGVIGPVLTCWLLYGLYRGQALWRRGDFVAGIFVFSSAPLLGVCLVVSLTRSVYVNWPLPVFLTLGLLFVHLAKVEKYLPDATSIKHRFWQWYLASICTSALMAVISFVLFAGFTLGLPPLMNPIKKLYGWSDLTQNISSVLDDHHDDKGRVPFVLTADYGLASILAYYGDSRFETYCANLDGRRMNQYDIWAGWEKLAGRDAIVVVPSADFLGQVRLHFASVLPLSNSNRIGVKLDGREIRAFELYIARSYDGRLWEVPYLR